MVGRLVQSGAKLVDTAGKPAPGKVPGAARKVASTRVLVVDDEALFRWAVAETLEAQGYEVAEAGDGASAIQACSGRDGATDVVLLDLRLPDSEDLRVLSALQRLSPATPVIVMTAYGTPELLSEARRLGAFSIVNKPLEMSDLAPLVERALAARLH
jgi:two-component system, NtrC family, response regulator HydG